MQIYRLDQILRNAALGILVYPPLHADNTITTLKKESLWYCMHCHTVSLHMETNDNLLYKNLVSFCWGYNGFWINRLDIGVLVTYFGENLINYITQCIFITYGLGISEVLN